MATPTHTPSKTPNPPAPFGPWVEWQTELCRNGRTLVTAVNQRDGRAMYLDSADLDIGSTRHADLLEDLHNGRFLLEDSPTAGLTKIAGAGFTWPAPTDSSAAPTTPDSAGHSAARG